MIGIEILKAEHQNILDFVDRFEKYFIDVLDGKEIDVNYIRESIKFIKEYADGHHHQKEENYLFKVMLDELGELAQKVITTGMLIEHDLNRLTVSELEASVDAYEESPTTKNKLDIIGHSMAYIYQIRRHIEKEDEAVFGFADRSLSEEGKDWVNQKTIEIERQSEELLDRYNLKSIVD